ncbi:MAG: formyltetrahydrofolate deformylase [Arcobacter butzleri]|nr:formyltetrahydrofolate deformylase [Arcobacteraceae bacterium]NLO17543.1 formyltetrahydrofolate deformylase [Aliarcobacter butzleri]
MSENFVLLIECDDQIGLVYQISKVIFNHNLNIKSNSEFVDEESKKFFMRTVVSGGLDQEVFLDELRAVLPKDALIRFSKQAKKNIIILATKESHVLGDLLIKNYENELDANILAVVSNHNLLKSLVEKFDIPYHHCDVGELNRQDHEYELSQIIELYNPDIIVLAKYMRVLTPWFVCKYDGKILNIHHSFLPAFIGANPYKQAHQRGVKIIGATAHLVTNDLDEGPIISQDIVRVDHSFSWQDMKKAGRNVEKVVLSNALDLLLEDRVFVHNNKTVIL